MKTFLVTLGNSDITGRFNPRTEVRLCRGDVVEFWIDAVDVPEDENDGPYEYTLHHSFRFTANGEKIAWSIVYLIEQDNKWYKTREVIKSMDCEKKNTWVTQYDNKIADPFAASS